MSLAFMQNLEVTKKIYRYIQELSDDRHLIKICKALLKYSTIEGADKEIILSNVLKKERKP